MEEELRFFDRTTAEKALVSLQGTVDEYRATHRTDTGIKNRLTRIAVLKMQIAADKRRVKASNRALEDIIEKEEAKMNNNLKSKS